MIDALSTFLRSTLERLDTPELRVAEEIELIEQYLRIQRYRFGARLHAVVEAEQEALGALIPTLILQPLVENAVRYSVLPREAGGSLWVSVRKELAVLIVSVEDDGPGLNGGTLYAFGMGLQNSSDRLKALYGAAASLTIGSRTDGTGCAVVIRLPFRLTPVIQPSDRCNRGRTSVKIRTVIADDEELARRGLRALSQRCEDLELICECRNGRETVDAIHRHRPDLVFLDVQMPGKTGFDVISAIADAHRPHVVFVTAYDKFALRAFEVHALDYLLKPVNEERFDAALARVRGRCRTLRTTQWFSAFDRWPRICRCQVTIDGVRCGPPSDQGQRTNNRHSSG